MTVVDNFLELSFELIPTAIKYEDIVFAFFFNVSFEDIIGKVISLGAVHILRQPPEGGKPKADHC